MDVIDALKKLALEKKWGSAILDFMNRPESPDNDKSLEKATKDGEDEKEKTKKQSNRGHNIKKLQLDEDIRRPKRRYIGRSEPARECSPYRREPSPCIEDHWRHGKNKSCPCNLRMFSGEDEYYQAKASYLERSRERKRYNRNKPVDPNFMDEFKIVIEPNIKPASKSGNERKRVLPLFPPEPNLEDEYYENEDGIWIKREVIRTLEDPFPIIHKPFYPMLYPEPKYATSEYRFVKK